MIPIRGWPAQTVWLPDGDWHDFFTGEHFDGGRWRTFYGGLDDIPVLARAGAIVPLGPAGGWGGVGAADELTIHIFAGANNRFDLYEDDGETQAYRQGKYAVTPIVLSSGADRLELAIGPVEGDVTQVPEGRTCRLVVHGIRRPDQISVTANGAGQPIRFGYDETAEALTLEPLPLGPADALRLALSVSHGALLSRRDRRVETCRKMLHAFALDAEVKWQIDNALPNILAGRVPLQRWGNALSGGQMAALRDAIG